MGATSLGIGMSAAERAPPAVSRVGRQEHGGLDCDAADHHRRPARRDWRVRETRKWRWVSLGGALRDAGQAIRGEQESPAGGIYEQPRRPRGQRSSRHPTLAASGEPGLDEHQDAPSVVVEGRRYREQQSTNLVNSISLSLSSSSSSSAAAAAAAAEATTTRFAPPRQLKPSPRATTTLTGLWRPNAKLARPSQDLVDLVAILLVTALVGLSLLTGESQGSSLPGGFLDSGHAITCTVGQLVNIGDYIPIDDPNVSRCYVCTCPKGVVKCDRAEGSPECMQPPPPSPPSSTKYSAFGRPAGKLGPVARQPGARPHQRPHHVPASNGKAKAMSSPSGAGAAQRKPVKSSAQGAGLSVGAGSTPIAQPISGGTKQAKPVVRLAHTTRQLDDELGDEERSGLAISHARNQDQEARALGPLHELTRTRTLMQQRSASSTRRQQGLWSDPLLTPYLPFDDQHHHKVAAESAGLPFDDYMGKLYDKRRILSDRTSTTPRLVSTTTTATRTTVSPLEEETPAEEPDSWLDRHASSQDETESLERQQAEGTPTVSTVGPTELDSTATTTTIIADLWPTTTLAETLEPLEETSTTTSDQREVDQDQDGANSLPAGSSGAADSTPGAPANGSHDPNRDTRPFKPGLETTSDDQQQRPDVFSSLSTLPPPLVFNGNGIDQSASNEVIEQVSQDGMLYIAIGVEAFIILTIVAMIIIIYIFREKAPHDYDDRGAAAELARATGRTHLQLPSRSPSIEKA